MPEDLIKVINKMNTFTNKIRINHFDSNQPVNRNHHSDNKNDNSLTSSNDKDNSDDGSCGKLDSSQQLRNLNSKKVVDHEVQNIMTKETNNSTSVSLTRLTNTGTSIPILFLQCLYEIQGLSLQYIRKYVITILCVPHLYKNISTVVRLLSSLRISLQVSLREDILHHLY